MGENSLFEVEYNPDNEVVIRIKSSKLHLMPDGTREHIKTARKEMMLALRDLIDSSLKREQDHESHKSENKSRRKKIVVE